MAEAVSWTIWSDETASVFFMNRWSWLCLLRIFTYMFFSMQGESLVKGKRIIRR